MTDPRDEVTRILQEFDRRGDAAEVLLPLVYDQLRLIAQRRMREKRGGGRAPTPLSVIDLAADQDPDEILALNDAIDTLEREDPRAAEVVKPRFFAGLSVEETAHALGVSERTTMREWAFARARLFQILKEGDG